MPLEWSPLNLEMLSRDGPTLYELKDACLTALRLGTDSRVLSPNRQNISGYGKNYPAAAGSISGYVFQHDTICALHACRVYSELFFCFGSHGMQPWLAVIL